MEIIRDWSTRQRGIVATGSLYNDAKQKATLYENMPVINVAYTDYGGTFADKTFIAFMKENYPHLILSEYTSWNGENAFIFGGIAEELSKSNDYFSVADDFEDYYLDAVSKLQEETADEVIDYYFADEELSDEERLRIWCAILTFFEECASCHTFGLDYDDFDLKEYLLKEINVNLEK